MRLVRTLSWKLGERGAVPAKERGTCCSLLRTSSTWSPRDMGERLMELPSTSYLFNPYLFLPSLAFSTSSISNMLHLLSIMFAARGQSISHVAQSTDNSYHPPIRKDFACGPLSCCASARFLVVRLIGVAGDNALAWPAKVWSGQPQTDLHRF